MTLMTWTKSNNFEGTSLMGEVRCTRADLENLFGEPDVAFDSAEKVTTEWCVQFSDGTVATIYDWKRYELGAPADDEWYRWHVGGRSAAALHRVVEMVYPNHAEDLEG